MKWLLIIALVLALALLAARGRNRTRHQVQRRLRSQFAHIARLRLVAACPQLDGVLHEADLRFVFDWMLVELCRRTGASDLPGLIRWSADRGEPEATRLNAEVTRAAIDRLPRPALDAIDQCQGRVVAGVLIDEALTEAGQRLAPKARR